MSCPCSTAARRKRNNAAIREAARRKTMLSRFAEAEDIAWAAVYLASQEASWVTAVDFSIDGGATAW